MSDTLLDAARQALAALEQLQGGCTDHDDGTVEALTVWCPEVCDALRTAIAEAEKAEPVAWRYRPGVSWPWALTDDGYLASCKRPSYQVEELFTHPPKREPLTDEQIAQCIVDARVNGPFARSGTTSFRIARAVERAHGLGGSNE